MANVLNSKRFVVRQSLVGKDATISVTFKNGNTVKYNHDKAFKVLSKMVYKNYHAFKSINLTLRLTIFLKF